jgi:PAS domain-containing protein
MNVQRGSKVTAYIIAVVSVLLATIITVGWPTLRNMHMLAAYLIAVLFTAYYGGLFPALLATILSSASFDYYIAPPAGFGMSDPADHARLASFIVIAGLVSFLHWQRVKAENKNRSMMQRLSLALEATKFGVWDLDLASGVVWYSPGMEEIVGRSADRFARSYEVFLGYVHPEDRDFVHRAVTGCIENGDECRIQYRIQLPSGEPRSVGTRAKVFFDEKRHPERLVAVTFDNSHRADVAVPPAAPIPAPRVAATA